MRMRISFFLPHNWKCNFSNFRSWLKKKQCRVSKLKFNRMIFEWLLSRKISKNKVGYKSKFNFAWFPRTFKFSINVSRSTDHYIQCNFQFRILLWLKLFLFICTIFPKTPSRLFNKKWERIILFTETTISSLKMI